MHFAMVGKRFDGRESWGNTNPRCHRDDIVRLETRLKGRRIRTIEPQAPINRLVDFLVQLFEP